MVIAHSTHTTLTITTATTSTKLVYLKMLNVSHKPQKEAKTQRSSQSAWVLVSQPSSRSNSSYCFVPVVLVLGSNWVNWRSCVICLTTALQVATVKHFLRIVKRCLMCMWVTLMLHQHLMLSSRGSPGMCLMSTANSQRLSTRMRLDVMANWSQRKANLCQAMGLSNRRWFLISKFEFDYLH